MEISEAYDSMPYPTKFFAQTHPDRLATLGSLFGIETKHPNKSRVLELGCGNGSNLISHAYNLKDSEFVGVDISAKHIREAKESVKELNLENIKFIEVDVLKMTVEEFGKFDYITAHGLISWIPKIISEKVFEIFQQMLEPNGIGYASYNAYPGAHHRDMVRQMMRYHTTKIDDPRKKVQESFKFLSILAENSNEKTIHQPIVQKELERHFRHSESDFYHDDLAEFYHPFYIHEFAETLQNNDLQFLCEAELHAMSIQGFPPQVQDLLNQKEDIIEKEQYLDFFHGRIFRQTLFCHQDVAIDRNIEPASIDNYLIASSVKPADVSSKQISVSVAERFIGSKGFGIEIDHPPTKMALKTLGENWGKAISAKELLQRVRQSLEKNDYKTDDWEKELEITKAIILQIYQGTDLIELHQYQADAFQEISETPKANDLCQWQIDCADNVTTQYYINIKIDDEVSRHLIKLLDGNNKREDLLIKIKDFIKTNDEIKDKENLLKDIDGWLDESLQQLSQLGMFVS